ncbi:MAG: carbamoyltransferase HypF [Candidatus Altiarchaeota archaeon]
MDFFRFFVRGVVQGVGFRPYVFRRAKELGLFGFVKNIGSGVEVVVNDSEFLDKLTDLPPLAKITGFEVDEYQPSKVFSDFSILESSKSYGETQLPADIFTCKDCLRELRDPIDRRNNYYFITCTNCGPRFSIIEDYPYDRPYTSMHDFEMCGECRVEYTNPMNRRFHAQTIACKKCGPKLIFRDGKKDISGENDIDSIKKAVDVIRSGDFVSIKGVGGFHICCLTGKKPVGGVRKTLGRPHKPFALMVRDVEKASEFSIISKKERELLESPRRPIVVVKKKNTYQFKEVSELDSIGLMLPYTALHYLMLDFIDQPLVMTSANIPGEPVALTEEIGRYFLTHERRIVNRCDDSVLKVISDWEFFLRRSRGYTPMPIKLPIDCRDTIAVGAELNNSISVSVGRNCYMSSYVGDTSKLETFDFLKKSVDTFIKLTRARPKVIACDLHPAYNSTSYARELSEKFQAKLVQVQHHKAHVAGVASEHGVTDYVGIAVDGLGFGEDGKIWGGEVCDIRDGTEFERIGSLEEQPQLGGDAATIYPKKMLFGILSKILDEKEILRLKLFDEKEARLYLNQLAEGFNVPLTTSAGRILDATAALLELCNERTYDGRPAMLLESIATKPLKIGPVIKKSDGRKQLSTTELFRFLLENKEKDKGRIAATAQMYLAEGLYQIAEDAADGRPIVLSGGVAYNKMISGYMIEKGVLVNKEIPAGDGGICYGQTYLANLIDKRKH